MAEKKKTPLQEAIDQPKVYNYIHEEGIIVEKATISEFEHHYGAFIKEGSTRAKTFVVSRPLQELWKADREVTEGKDFKLDLALHRVKGSQMAHEPSMTAVPVSKSETISIDHSEGELPVDGLLDEQSATVCEDEIWQEMATELFNWRNVKLDSRDISFLNPNTQSPVNKYNNG